MTLSSPVETAPGRHHEPYFHHDNRPAPAVAGVLQPVTRYLCGAAYLDESFGEEVIGELIEDEHRAVAPSYGFDLDPVVRHCFRARRLWLVQNAALSGVLLIGLVAARTPTIILLGLMLVISIPLAVRHGTRMPTWKLLIIAVLSLIAVSMLLGVLGAIVSVSSILSRGDPVSPEFQSQPSGSSTGAVLVQMLLLAVAMIGTLTWARYVMLRTLATDLLPGAVHTPPVVHGRRIAARLDTVARAQRGNIALHAGFEPFLGAGRSLLRAWSVVVELRPSGRPDDRSDPTRDPIDPVALNRHLKQRVAALRSAELPERQRVSGLRLRDYVVASGSRWRDYPLVDPHRVPYAVASQAAIEAIIRHPQASARHFLRVTTGTEGKEVYEGDRVLLTAEDQEVQVSGFIHIAVEGGMLYVEYVSTMQGAIKPSYHEIDELPMDPSDLLGRATLDALRRLTMTAILAPFRLVGGLVRAMAVNSRMNAADKQSRDAPVYNYGARKSVRTLASIRDADTYTRRLDAEKYSKLIERRINDAVLDYLEIQQVDTSEYRTRVNIIMSQTNISGGMFYGPVASGTGSSATTQQATSNTPAGQGE